MLNNFLNTVKDIGFVRVTKENYAKIEELFAKKEKLINDQAAIIEVQQAELETLRKYKENDDILYSYEMGYRKITKENEILRGEISKFETALISMDRKVSSAMSLESAYLQRIIKAESAARQNPCPKYETKGDFLLAHYGN